GGKKHPAGATGQAGAVIIGGHQTQGSDGRSCVHPQERVEAAATRINTRRAVDRRGPIKPDRAPAVEPGVVRLARLFGASVTVAVRDGGLPGQKPSVGKIVIGRLALAGQRHEQGKNTERKYREEFFHDNDNTFSWDVGGFEEILARGIQASDKK